MRKLQRKPTRFKTLSNRGGRKNMMMVIFIRGKGTTLLYMRERIRFTRDEILGLRAHKIITKRTLKFSIYYFQFFISLNLAFP